MQFDHIDRKLITELQQDAKQTNKQLSAKLSLSVTAVYERIRKLERLGVITAYGARVDQTTLGLPMTVFCHIKLAGHSRNFLGKFEKQVTELEEVLECFHVSGAYDYLLKIAVKDMEHFRNFMVNKLTNLEHIGSTQSSFVIETMKSSNLIPIID
ncbi:Lrp/AsnC family transcriptional regulator [Aureitalea marina]|uniref:AsnC family transcriptional regulator n=1 Tax=Aureitalea marina TaxID=930804 RepID=A0A2S7KND8_9FLAO|nr:Lrp/AsnC family transcriptional regulator [Aureitalea marina]PQB04139.1 AsnC family transcriptional regulator [Aureitalea marina]